jgi:hypothetical protein
MYCVQFILFYSIRYWVNSTDTQNSKSGPTQGNRRACSTMTALTQNSSERQRGRVHTTSFPEGDGAGAGAKAAEAVTLGGTLSGKTFKRSESVTTAHCSLPDRDDDLRSPRVSLPLRAGGGPAAEQSPCRTEQSLFSCSFVLTLRHFKTLLF